MKNTVASLFVLAACLAVHGSASAQSVRHDIMDARAARADILRLKADRRAARMQRDWGKVKQDNRLIADDMKFLRKDRHKIRHSGD